MHKPRACGIVGCIALAAALLWSGRLAAASHVVIDEAALLAGADGYVHVRVLADISAAPSVHGLVTSTRYALAVDRNWGGSPGTRTATVAALRYAMTIVRLRRPSIRRTREPTWCCSPTRSRSGGDRSRLSFCSSTRGGAVGRH